MNQVLKAAAKKTPMYWAYSKARKCVHTFNREQQRRRRLVAEALTLPRIIIAQSAGLSKTAALYDMAFFLEFVQHGFYGAEICKTKERGYEKAILVYNVRYFYFPLEKCYAESFDAYFKEIKCAERALIRKAQKNGFVCKEISYDEHRDEIFAINTSKEVRQGKKMTDSYWEYPVERDKLMASVGQVTHCYGCFDNAGTLKAYAIYDKHGDVFHTARFLGHKDVLSFGVMNYLFCYALQSLSRDYAGCKMMYGGGGGGWTAFHYSRNTRA